MKQTLLILFLFSTTSIFAQTIQWQNTIGGNDYDWCDFIEPTSDGNYISGGYSYSNISGDKTENSRGLNDFWLFKIDDASGNLLWQKTIGGNGNEHLISAKETVDGGFILGGYSSSGISGEKTQNSRGGDDYWVVKLDVNRNIIWDKTYGGAQTDRLTCIIETEDGGYLIAGESNSNISGDKTENSKGNVDMWLIKIDQTGSIIWQKTIGGNNIDSVTKIINTSDHNYVLAGTSDSNISGDKTENSKGFSDYWILKIDLNGSIIWQNTIGGSNGENLKSIVATSDGNYIIGGDSASNISADKTENTINGSPDVWLVKLNNNGQLIWQKNIGSNNTESLANMRITSDTGLVLGLMSYSGISGIKTEASRGDRDYWIVKLDSNNNFEWDKTFGGSSIDQTQSIIQSKDGSYVVAGWSQSNISGDKTEDKSGLQDIWVLKFNICQQPLPTLNSPQTFCIQQNATLNDIQITGQNIKWYSNQTAGTLVPITTVVQDKTIYYASQTINGCESERVPVKTNIQVTSTPSGNPDQSFCTAQNSTIGNIEITGTSIKWYDSITNGSLIAETTPLENGKTYYASQTINNCEGPRFGVTIALVNTPVAPTGNTNQEFCKIQNATLNDIVISGQNIKWYDTSFSAASLPSTTLLENNKTFYASQTMGCESERTPILVHVYDTPVPNGNKNQQFCIDEIATIEDLNITGTNLIWYDAVTNGNILTETTLLENKIYYVTQTLNNCESERLPVTVKIQDTQIPISNSPQQFCTQKNAKINDIEINGQNIKWYESISATNTLPESTLLENGITYYASQTVSTCESDKIPVTINILEATSKDCINLVNELPYPKFFTPNGDGYNDTWTVEFIYLAPNTGIKIYDRYGKFIKELRPDTAWDGTYNGHSEPAADYWFTVTRLNGTEFRGHFTLKR